MWWCHSFFSFYFFHKDFSFSFILKQMIKYAVKNLAKVGNSVEEKISNIVATGVTREFQTNLVVENWFFTIFWTEIAKTSRKSLAKFCATYTLFSCDVLISTFSRLLMCTTVSIIFFQRHLFHRYALQTKKTLEWRMNGRFKYIEFTYLFQMLGFIYFWLLYMSNLALLEYFNKGSPLFTI